MSNRIWRVGNCIYRIDDYELYDFDNSYYNNVLYLKDDLNEGLLYAYSAQSSEKYLKSLYPNIVSVNNYNTGITQLVPSEFDCSDFNNMHIEFSVLIHRYYDNIESIVQKVRNLCGWFPYVVRVCYKDYKKNNIPVSIFISYSDFCNDSNWNIDFKIHMLYYEKICMEIYFICGHHNGIIENGYFKDKFLYHCTKANKIYKIGKNGLCPRNKDNNAMLLCCVYFTDKIDAIFPMINSNNANGRILLRFAGNNIKCANCQYDIKHSNAYYTTENIHPRNIEIYCDNGWKPIIETIKQNYSIKTMDEVIYDFNNDSALLEN